MAAIFAGPSKRRKVWENAAKLLLNRCGYKNSWVPFDLVDVKGQLSRTDLSNCDFANSSPSTNAGHRTSGHFSRCLSCLTTNFILSRCSLPVRTNRALRSVQEKKCEQQYYPNCEISEESRDESIAKFSWSQQNFVCDVEVRNLSQKQMESKDFQIFQHLVENIPTKNEVETTRMGHESERNPLQGMVVRIMTQKHIENTDPRENRLFGADCCDRKHQGSDHERVGKRVKKRGNKKTHEKTSLSAPSPNL